MYTICLKSQVYICIFYVEYILTQRSGTRSMPSLLVALENCKPGLEMCSSFLSLHETFSSCLIFVFENLKGNLFTEA